LADPHILLPSAADLTRAFVADLGNVLQGDTQPPQFTLLFWTGTGGQVTWTAPFDLVIVGVTNVSGSTSLCLGTDSSSYTANFAAAGNLKLGSVIFLGGTSQQVFTPTRFPIPHLQKIWFTNNGASNGSLLMFFEKA